MELEAQALQHKGLGIVVCGRGRVVTQEELRGGGKELEGWLRGAFEGGQAWLGEVMEGKSGMLPGVVAELGKVYEVVKREAKVAELQGQSGPRSEESLRRRAGAVLLHRQAAGLLACGGRVTASHARKIVANAAKVAKGWDKERKAHYGNLYDLAEVSGAEMRGRDDKVVMSERVQGKEGELASVDTKGLVEMWEEKVGRVSDDHPIFRILHESRAHAPRFHPTLARMLEEAGARGEALQFLPAVAEKLSVECPRGCGTRYRN